MLKDKVVIVTGAAAGLGAGIARVCSQEGAHVVVADINASGAERLASELGGSACSVHCDVSDEASVDALITSTLERFGRIDGLVNNAGLNFVKPFLETTTADWDRIMAVDLRAVFFLTQKVARQMLTQSPTSGSVVNIGSVHTLAAISGAGPYDAAKCGVVGFSRSIAIELATAGIRVNVVSPGLVQTEIWKDIVAAAPSEEAALDYWRANIPMGRLIEPGEIGQLCAFLLSDRSSCITGANMIADAGMTAQLVSQEPYDSDAMDGQ